MAKTPAYEIERIRRWQQDNAGHVGEYNRNWKQRNPLKRGLYEFKSRYKIASLDEARAILATKPSRCDVCGGTYKICYDHDHNTGEHRGWLCQHCNTTLGNVKDDPDILRALVAYLEGEGGG